MNNLKKNLLIGFIGQIVIIVIGLIVPRIIILNYGSDLNGVISTITQIYTYLLLLEAGIGVAAQNALYEPFQTNNRRKIIYIATATRLYFKKISNYYIIGVIIFSIVLPFYLKSHLDPFTMFCIVVLEGMSNVITFYFVETPSIILNVDGKGYINNEVVFVNKILGFSTKILMATFGLNIVLIYLMNFVFAFVKVIIYSIYLRKKYSWLKFTNNENNYKLPDRKSYVLTELCWTIFSSTDMVILSLFISTQITSVYSIYNMVFFNIAQFANTVYMSVTYLLGFTYHCSLKRYTRLHDCYNSFFIGIMTLFMSVCYIMILPFVSLYTKGVDENYIYDFLPLLFCLIQLLSWSRYVSGNLTGIAGYAKQTSYVSLLEACLNLMLSIIFVKKMGIEGVTLATVLVLPIKVIWCTYIADKKVMKRSYRKSISIIGCNFLFFFSVCAVSKFYQPTITSYFQFFVWVFLLTIVLGFVCVVLNLIVNKDCYFILKKNLGITLHFKKRNLLKQQ